MYLLEQIRIIWRPHKVSQLGYYLFRGLTRIGTLPFRRLRESERKNRIREYFLRFQHSLPTEFMVNSGDVVCQIGTPWPGTLLRFRKRIGGSGKLVIFEAFPENADVLRSTVEAHGFTNVQIVQAAAWSSDADGNLSVSPYSGDHKIAIDDINMDYYQLG